MTLHVKERTPYSPSWRCRLSHAGHLAHPLHVWQRRGRVIGESSDYQSWYVLWDGIQTPALYHKDFINVTPRSSL